MEAELAAANGQGAGSVRRVVSDAGDIKPCGVGKIGRGDHVLNLIRNADAHVARNERAWKDVRVLDEARTAIADDVTPAFRNRVVFRDHREADVQHRQHRTREVVDLIESVAAAAAPGGKCFDHRAEGHGGHHASVFEAVHRGRVRKERRSGGDDAKRFGNRLHRPEKRDRRKGDSRIVRGNQRAVGDRPLQQNQREERWRDDTSLAREEHDARGKCKRRELGDESRDIGRAASHPRGTGSQKNQQSGHHRAGAIRNRVDRERRKNAEAERNRRRKPVVHREFEQRQPMEKLRDRPYLGARHQADHAENGEEPSLACARSPQRENRQRQRDAPSLRMREQEVPERRSREWK